jgi:hypothetical protein
MFYRLSALALLLAACADSEFIALEDDASALHHRADAMSDSLILADLTPTVDAEIPDAGIPDIVVPPLPPYQPDTQQIGPAAVAGTYKGEPIAVTHAWGFRIAVLDANLDALILMPAGGSCTFAAQAMPTRLMYFQLCSNGTKLQNTGDLCELEGVSYYTDAKLSLPDTDPVTGSGTITLDELDTSNGGSVRGTFKLVFDGEKIDGKFDTVGCGPFGEGI